MTDAIIARENTTIYVRRVNAEEYSNHTDSFSVTCPDCGTDGFSTLQRDGEPTFHCRKCIKWFPDHEATFITIEIHL